LQHRKPTRWQTFSPPKVSIKLHFSPENCNQRYCGTTKTKNKTHVSQTIVVVVYAVIVGIALGAAALCVLLVIGVACVCRRRVAADSDSYVARNPSYSGNTVRSSY
jgi:hypothetical protein